MKNLLKTRLKRSIRSLSLMTSFLFGSVSLSAQERFVPLSYGDMEQWVERTIHESGVIGGKDKLLYEIGPSQKMTSNEAYSNLGGSPWGTSNVLAKVMGVVKTNNTVYRDSRPGGGFCCRMETHIEQVKVLGLMNINVLAAGSIFLGDMKEPITGTKEGVQAMNWGIPYTERPSALRYDYRTKIMDQPSRIRLTGFSKRGVVVGQDKAITVLLLQKRSENAQGEITALRVGTLIVTYSRSTDGWVNAATYPILYGDITKRADYNPELMGLRQTDYARNSKGEMVPVKEIGWAKADEAPTHLLLQFSSSHGGAYVGTPGNTLWVDNVGMVFN